MMERYVRYFAEAKLEEGFESVIRGGDAGKIAQAVAQMITPIQDQSGNVVPTDRDQKIYQRFLADVKAKPGLQADKIWQNALKIAFARESPKRGREGKTTDM